MKDAIPAGFGRIDAQLAADLSRAATLAAADKVARDHGLKDAADALAWLQGRS